MALLLMGSTPVFATDDSVVAPKRPKPLQRVIVNTETGVIPPGLLEDSIFAREITIDMGGIRIVDREGREIILPAHIPGPGELPNLPEIGGGLLEGERFQFDPEGGQDQVTQIASNIYVREDEVVRGEVVCVFCDILVAGTVTGSAVSVFGNVNVEGKVGDEAVAPFGRVTVGPNGEVRGDAFASRISREPGGRIDGDRNEVFLNPFGGEDGLGEAWSRRTFTILVVLKILFWLFLVLLAHALAARNITKVKERLQQSYVKSFFMGIVGQLLILPVFLLLLVTIIGIPVALFVLPLMMFAGLVLAYAAVGQIVGDKIDQNTTFTLRSPLSRTIAGVAALQLFAYLTIVFIWPAGHGSAGGTFRLITVVMFILSAIMGYVVITLGTGAVILTRFGTRPKDTSVVTPIPQSGQVDAAAALPQSTPLPFRPNRPDESGTAPAPSS